MFIQVIPTYFFLAVPLNAIIHFKILAPCLLKTAPYILKNSSSYVCDTREGHWAEQLRIRLSGPCAASDLHAPDARYHNDCRLKFMAGRSVLYASIKTSDQDLTSVDEAYETVKSLLDNNRKVCGHRLKSKRFIKTMEAFDYQGTV